MSLRSWFERYYPGTEGLTVVEYLAKMAEADRERATPKSRLTIVNNTPPSRDEFAAWRDDRVTRFVMRALEYNADECREEWLRKSWEAGQADQRTLDALRERSDALLGFTADYEAFCETLGLEPQEEEQAA